MEGSPQAIALTNLNLSCATIGPCFIEFHPSYSLVNDSIIGAILVTFACENGVYTLQYPLVGSSPKKVCKWNERMLIDGWYKQLSRKIMVYLQKL